MSEPETEQFKGKADWINTILDLLKDTDSESCKNSLEGCGQKCFKESEVLERAKEISQKTEGLTHHEVLLMVQKEIFGQENNAPKIYSKDGVIYLKYSRCMCPIKNEEDEYDDFLCECTKGFAKSLCETLFNRSADITILKSIIRGDDSCLLAIRLI